MRDKIIETILDSKDEFISGEELSKKLGIFGMYRGYFGTMVSVCTHNNF